MWQLTELKVQLHIAICSVCDKSPNDLPAAQATYQENHRGHVYVPCQLQANNAQITQANTRLTTEFVI